MYNANFPHKSELPSTAKLVKSTIIAAATALVILLTVVMPAEYGLDPTGIGNLLGLKKMGEIKMSLAREAAAKQNASAAAPAAADLRMAVAVQEIPAGGRPRTDELKLTLAPNQGAEIKVELAKGRQVKYSWSSSGGKANYDVHGDSEKLGISYHGYAKGSQQRAEGVLKAAFDGHHGWFWRNRTKAPLTVTLKVTGDHTGVKKVN